MGVCFALFLSKVQINQPISDIFISATFYSLNCSIRSQPIICKKIICLSMHLITTSWQPCNITSVPHFFKTQTQPPNYNHSCQSYNTNYYKPFLTDEAWPSLKEYTKREWIFPKKYYPRRLVLHIKSTKDFVLNPHDSQLDTLYITINDRGQGYCK